MKEEMWTEGHPPPDEPVTYSKLQLEALTIRLKQVLSEHLLSAKVDAALDAWSDRIIVSVQGYIWQEKLEDLTVPVSFRVPTTWWQMLKRDYAPAWFIDRFPVRMKTVTKKVRYKTYGKFPEYRYVAPPGLGPVVFHRSGEEVHRDQP